MTNLVLVRRGDLADVYFPVLDDYDENAENAFPIVAVMQGGDVDKSLCADSPDVPGFGRQLARFGLVVVIPNNFQYPFLPPFLLPALDKDVIPDVLYQMKIENRNPKSELLGIVDTTCRDLAGHSFGGALGLFANANSCSPLFCDGSFNPPGELHAGAFNGTNSRNPFTGVLHNPDTSNFPVALVQGSLDGISSLKEGLATFDSLDEHGDLRC